MTDSGQLSKATFRIEHAGLDGRKPPTAAAIARFREHVEVQAGACRFVTRWPRAEDVLAATVVIEPCNTNHVGTITLAHLTEVLAAFYAHRGAATVDVRPPTKNAPFTGFTVLVTVTEMRAPLAPDEARRQVYEARPEVINGQLPNVLRDGETPAYLEEPPRDERGRMIAVLPPSETDASLERCGGCESKTCPDCNATGPRMLQREVRVEPTGGGTKGRVRKKPRSMGLGGSLVEILNGPTKPGRPAVFGDRQTERIRTTGPADTQARVADSGLPDIAEVADSLLATPEARAIEAELRAAN